MEVHLISEKEEEGEGMEEAAGYSQKWQCVQEGRKKVRKEAHSNKYWLKTSQT